MALTIKNWKLRGIWNRKEKDQIILPTIFTTENMFDKRLSKFALLKTLKVSSCISSFLSNFRKCWLKDPLNTNELLKQIKFIMTKVQLHYNDTQMFKINQKQLYVK